MNARVASEHAHHSATVGVNYNQNIGRVWHKVFVIQHVKRAELKVTTVQSPLETIEQFDAWNVAASEEIFEE